ncbi:MAG TPA: DNA polymerase IV [candidate division Zixibacteria bacterium]|nr:DNA polymerase IV [candidate division Zixibacteria bacterium]
MAHISRLIAHVDMDSFFTAVEVLDDPSLAGKPVMVGADPRGGRGRGVVSAASYEARRFGVHSAMPVSRAFRLCPRGVFLPGRMERYQEVSGQVMTVLSGFTPVMEQISVDEAFLDLTGCGRLLGGPGETGVKIKKAVKAATGLTASVGLGPNKLAAKIASDLEKPDGLVVVAQPDVGVFLSSLPIRRLWGIGPKTEEALKKKFRVATVGELAGIPPERLEKEYGLMGRYLHQRANGVDDDPVGGDEEAKSIGRETTFDSDTSDQKQIHKTLVYLCDRVAGRLRASGAAGRTVTLKLRYESFETHTFRQTLAAPTDVYREILELAEMLFQNNYMAGRKVRLLGVSVSNFSDSPELGLFDETGKNREKQRKVELAVDKVRGKYGKRSVLRAGEL